MGHNLCMDIFGRAVARMRPRPGSTVHGEAPVAVYEIVAGDSELTARSHLPAIAVTLRAENPAAAGERGGRDHRNSGKRERHRPTHRLDRARDDGAAMAAKSAPPIPRLCNPVPNSSSISEDGYMKTGAQFDWPMVPRMAASPVSRRGERGVHHPPDGPAPATPPYFLAWSPASRLAFGYVWRRADFPWLGIWEENHSRTGAPWNGRTLTRGMEFGASPMPETRRQMIARGTLFGMPAFRWIPARTRVETRYRAAASRARGDPQPPRLGTGGRGPV